MKYRKYCREEKEALTAEWLETGTNRTVFARRYGINTQTFMNWTKENKTEEQKFVQLAVPCKRKEDGGKNHEPKFRKNFNLWSWRSTK
jgi:transposase-like protein